MLIANNNLHYFVDFEKCELQEEVNRLCYPAGGGRSVFYKRVNKKHDLMCLKYQVLSVTDSGPILRYQPVGDNRSWGTSGRELWSF